jgi:hypothetical protein
MSDFLRTLVVSILSVQMIAVYAASPAAALSAELAKKCRDMAIKSHPPPYPPGNRPYAQAENEFFRLCISKNGQMSE